MGVAAAVLLVGRRWAGGSAGDHGHPLQVVGEDPQADADLGATQPMQARPGGARSCA